VRITFSKSDPITMIEHEPEWPQALPGQLQHPGEVHVWRARLDTTPAQTERLLAILSDDEVERAGRYRFEKDRKQFIAARGTLRRILGYYLTAQPEQLRFQYSQHGKPALAGGDDDLRFNLSHAGAWALFAITSGRELGIDIERMRDDVNIDQIAPQFFSPGELRALELAGENKRKQLFYHLWARKEAFIKATGKGMTFPLEQVDVSAATEGVLSPVSLFADAEASGPWYVQDLFPIRGYAAALAIERGKGDVFCWHYEG
jgi:4'-phosphopantetheinyl transferase